MTLVLAGLILNEPDFGTAAVLVGIVTMMVFAAGLSYRYVFGAVLVLLPAAHAHRDELAVPHASAS